MGTMVILGQLSLAFIWGC